MDADELVCVPDDTLRDIAAQSPHASRGARRQQPCKTGRYVKARRFVAGEPLIDLAVDATLRAAAYRQAGQKGRVFGLRSGDLRRKVRMRPGKALVVFAVDASESMALDARLSVAKGAALGLLRTAYLQRDRVALVVFEGESARTLLEPTSSIELARERLRQIPVGGATPLAAGLYQAWRIFETERIRHPWGTPTLVLITDGRANESINPRANVRQELLAMARSLRQAGIRSLVVDVGKPHPQLVELAQHLGASCLRVDRGGLAAVVNAVYVASHRTMKS